MNFKELLFKAVEKAINTYVETGNIGKNDFNIINLYAKYYEFPVGLEMVDLSGNEPYYVGD